MSKPTTNKFSAEVRDRAVRMVFDHQAEHPSQWAAINSIAGKIGCTGETLRSWVRRSERDQRLRAGPTTQDGERIKALERENRELRQANEILTQGVGVFCPGGARPPVQAMIAFIDDHRGAYGVEPICRVLPIAPSTYRTHAVRRTDPTRLPARAQRDLVLTGDIQRVFDANSRDGHHRLPEDGGTLENATAMANHASTRTTQLYDRQRDDISLDEVERIRGVASLASCLQCPVSHQLQAEEQPGGASPVCPALRADRSRRASPGVRHRWICPGCGCVGQVRTDGAYARRAWFLFEWLTGRTLDVPDAGAVSYVHALDPAIHVTARGVPSRRHRVTDNIPGRPGRAPMVRRTQCLARWQKEDVAAEARAIATGCDPAILARAVSYLYTKEMKSSFEIEHETATGQRAERFVAALRAASLFESTDPGSLVALQNTIVDPRYAATGFRDLQNFVGETMGGYREVVHFICPRPEDVQPLMAAWGEMTGRLQGGMTDPVVAATLVAFGFVFIHPFEDGNGRIRRFLIHQVLSREGFTPPGLLFPVSAAISRDRKGYDAVLETFSKAIQAHVDWHWTADRNIAVDSETASLYGYYDATPLVRYLSLFVHLCLQNGGRLGEARRDLFTELTDGELAVLQDAMEAILVEHEMSGAVSLAND